MVDRTQIRYSGDWIFYQGEVAGAATLTVYDAGTTNLATIYSDKDLTTSTSNPLTADANGLMPFAYIGTQAYKVLLKTSDGTTIDTEDQLPGAVDTSGFDAAAYAKLDHDVEAITADDTMTTDDIGTTKNVNPSTADVTITLDSAVDYGNGREITIRHIGTDSSYKVLIVTVSSQTISGPFTDGAPSSFALKAYGESVTLRSDAANWHIVNYAPPFMMPDTPGVIRIADRITADPTATVGGTRYIVTSGFTVGAQTFEAEDIIEFTGQSNTYIEYTPPTDCGWLAYVEDENRLYQFKASAWVALASEPATTAEMETATDTEKTVTPGLQHRHPGHPKIWCEFTMTGSATSNYNTSSVTDEGTGHATITYGITLSAGGAVVATGNEDDNVVRACIYRAAGTTSHKVLFINASSVVADCDNGGGTCVFGDI